MGREELRSLGTIPESASREGSYLNSGDPPVRPPLPQEVNPMFHFTAASQPQGQSATEFSRAIQRHPFSFDEAHEKAAVSKMFQIIGVAVASGIFFLMAFVWSFVLSRSMERGFLLLLSSVSIFLVCCAVSWPVIYWAKTRPVYAPICSAAASATILCYRTVSYITGWAGDDQRMGTYPLMLPLILLVVIGLLAKSPLLWLYGMLMSVAMILLGIASSFGNLKLLIPFAIITLNLTIFAAYKHRQKISAKQSGGE